MRILVFGDSLVQGSFDVESGGWVNRLAGLYYQRAIDQNQYINTHNLGIGGETCVDLLKRVKIESEHRPTSERISIVLSGTNDSKWKMKERENLVSLEEFSKAYAGLVHYLMSISDRVVCLGLPRADEAKTNPCLPTEEVAFRNDELTRYEAVIKKMAETKKILYININDAYDPKTHTVDGLHPNAEGHRLIYERVKTALQEASIL